jgi:UDP-glucose 6-dehydrogenase
MFFDLHKRILSIVFGILDFNEVSGFVNDCVVFLILIVKNVLFVTEISFINELDKSSCDVNIENIFGIVVLML